VTDRPQTELSPWCGVLIQALIFTLINKLRIIM